jgi:hypothetical protein
VETQDFKTWNFILGVTKVPDGIAADWLVTMKINDDQSVTVSTPQYLTKDGVLVHGEHHDALRAELLRALALGQLTDADSEAQMSAASLKIRQNFESAGPDRSSVSFRYSTSLSSEEARGRLRIVGMRVLQATPESFRWGLGLPKDSGENYATATIAPGTIEVEAQIEAETAVSRRMAASDLRFLTARIRLCLRTKDEAAQYHGPSEFAP